VLYGLVCVLVLAVFVSAQPDSNNGGGLATVTVYSTSSFQNGNTGACNCVTGVENYPTVAMSQNYFGVGPGQGAGPACGKCFHLHIYGDPYDSNWCSDSYDIVVKVADECPNAGNEAWCPAYPGQVNQFGAGIHFDMAENSWWVQQIVSATGRGAFLAKYCEVDCNQWTGFSAGGTYGTQTSDWGYCPQDNLAGYAGACSIPAQCSGAPPTTTGGGTPSGIVWANGVNSWWVAFAVSASTVYLDCGNGWVLLPYAGYTISGVPVWVWQGTGYQCAPVVNIDYDGNVVTGIALP